MMGQTPLACFPKTNSHVATNKRDPDGRTWPQAMCLHISKQKSKPLAKSLKTKQYHKSSYTIFKGLSNEKRGEWINVEINAFLSKTISIYELKSSTKGGRSTSTNGWKWWRVCSSYNVFQFFAMHWRKWVWVSWWPYSPPYGRNDKHQEWKSKNACQVVVLDGSMANWIKRIHKTC